MKIISQPDYTTWTYEFTCYACKSKLRADHTDLKYGLTKKWYDDSYGDGGYHADVDRYHLLCAVCGKETEIQPNQKGVEIPYLLQEKLKRDFRGTK